MDTPSQARPRKTGREGVTTIPEGSRAKRPEAHRTPQGPLGLVGDEIVCSAAETRSGPKGRSRPSDPGRTQGLHQKLNFVGTVSREYDDRFARQGAKVGDTLKVRLPCPLPTPPTHRITTGGET